MLAFFLWLSFLGDVCLFVVMYWSFLSCLKMIWQLWFILLFVFVTTVFYFLLLSPQSQTSGSSFSPRFQEDTKPIHPTFYPDTKHCAAEDSVWVMVTELGLVWSVFLLLTRRSSDMCMSSSLKLLKVDSSRRMLLSAVRRVWHTNTEKVTPERGQKKQRCEAQCFAVVNII